MRSTANVLYLASREGIHKSTDGGQSWKAMNAGLSNLNIRALAISPLDSNTLYTGTNGSGLFRSRDGGESWEAVPLVVSQPFVLIFPCLNNVYCNGRYPEENFVISVD